MRLIGFLFLFAIPAVAEVHVTTLADRIPPGVTPVNRLALLANDATRVDLRHSGSDWSVSHPLAYTNERWEISLDEAGMLVPDFYQYKFLIDGRWEPGENRILYRTPEGTTGYPPALYLTWQQDPTTTMTIHWHSDHPTDRSEVQYRAADAEEWQFASGSKAPFPFTIRWVHTVELVDLQPDTRYVFRRADADQELAFVTMPTQLDQPLTFVIGGDIFHHKERMDRMNALVAALDPAFMVMGGDLAYADGAPQNAMRWHQFFESLYHHATTADGRLIPHLIAVGNHEVQRHYYFNNDDYAATDAWRERVAPYFFALYAFPGQPGYNVMDFGNYLSFVFLDTDHVNPVPGVQTDWLASVLAPRARLPHLFPVYHVMAYPAQRSFEDRTAAAIREHWIPLFEQTDIRLAFEHHDHTFKITHPLRGGKIDPDGIVYAGDGAWAVDVREVRRPEDVWYLRRAESINHVYEVVIDPHRRIVRAHALDGQLLDFFEQPVRKP